MLSRAVAQDHLYATAMLNFLFSKPVTCNREEKFVQFQKLAKSVTLPDNGAKNFVRKGERVEVQSKPCRSICQCSSSGCVCIVNVLLRSTVCSKRYKGSYPQGGFAMEAFLVLIVLVFEKKTKVLLCLRIGKENNAKRR